MAVDQDQGAGQARALARGLLQIADDAGIPDVMWQTDSRVKLARDVLGVPESGRYSHDHLWSDSQPGRRRTREDTLRELAAALLCGDEIGSVTALSGGQAEVTLLTVEPLAAPGRST